MYGRTVRMFALERVIADLKHSARAGKTGDFLRR